MQNCNIQTGLHGSGTSNTPPTFSLKARYAQQAQIIITIAHSNRNFQMNHRSQQSRRTLTNLLIARPTLESSASTRLPGFGHRLAFTARVASGASVALATSAPSASQVRTFAHFALLQRSALSRLCTPPGRAEQLQGSFHRAPFSASPLTPASSDFVSTPPFFQVLLSSCPPFNT